MEKEKSPKFQLINPKFVHAKSSFEPIEPIDTVDFDRGENRVFWDKLKEVYKPHLEVTEGNDIASDLRNNVKNIGAGFAFEPDQGDEDFLKFHIENLLDQAADLFDRATQEREKHDAAAAKQLQLSLELGEYFDLDEIHKEEELAGYYTHESDWAANEHKTEFESYFQNQRQYESGLVLFKTFFNMDELNEVFVAEVRMAWLTGAISYLMEEQRFKEFIYYTFNDEKRTIPDHGLAGGKVRSNWQLNFQMQSWLYENEVHKRSQAVSNQKIDGLISQASWKLMESEFKKRRTKAARQYQDLKSRAATDPEGILNYIKYIEQIRRRFHRDFRDAIARIKVAQQGLSEIFGYDEPLPDNEEEISYFDDCNYWNRVAVQWFVRFSERDQSCIIPISLRNLVGEQAWGNFLASGVLEFNLGDQEFDGMCMVRARGLGIVVVDREAEEGLWGFSVQVPGSGKITSLDGYSRVVDQQNLPLSNTFRCTNRQPGRDVDVVAGSVWHNASPIGLWKLKLLRRVPRAVSQDSLNDIVIDLHLAYRSKPRGE